jgi:hypothetical protein
VNSFIPFEPDARLRRLALITLFLKERRRHNPPLAQSAPADVVDAVAQSVETYIVSLQNDVSAQLFLPHAIQAATMWLSMIEHGHENEAFEKAESSRLPHRYKDLLLLKNSRLVLAGSRLELSMGLSWDDLTFWAIELRFGTNTSGFAEVVCQSLRELFYLTYPTLALKQRFLKEEEFKLERGYYPDSIRPPLSQLLARLRTDYSKLEEDISKIPGGERNFLLNWISPLSNPMIAGLCSVTTRSFTDVEERVFGHLQNSGLEFFPPISQEEYPFLLALRNEQGANAANFAIEHPMYGMFEFAHYYLTRCCNTLGRHMWEKQYQELQPRALRVPGMNITQLVLGAVKSYPEAANALVPGCMTIDMIWETN